MSTIRVETTSEFPHVVPAHKRWITAQGDGSNLDRAVRCAIQNTFKDSRLRGRKAKTILEGEVTIRVRLVGEVTPDAN